MDEGGDGEAELENEGLKLREIPEKRLLNWIRGVGLFILTLDSKKL